MPHPGPPLFCCMFYLNSLPYSVGSSALECDLVTDLRAYGDEDKQMGIKLQEEVQEPPKCHSVCLN